MAPWVQMWKLSTEGSFAQHIRSQSWSQGGSLSPLPLFCPRTAPSLQSLPFASDSCQTLVLLTHCIPRPGGPCSVSSPCGGSVLEGPCWTRTLGSLAVPGSHHGDCQSLGGMKEGSGSRGKPGDKLCVRVGLCARQGGRQDPGGAAAAASGTQALLFPGLSIAYLGHIPSFIEQLLCAGLSGHREHSCGPDGTPHGPVRWLGQSQAVGPWRGWQ